MNGNCQGRVVYAKGTKVEPGGPKEACVIHIPLMNFWTFKPTM